MLSDNIKKYRQIQGLTQKQLADKVGISGAFMSLIEQGKNNPSDENLKKIARVLGVSVEELTIEESNTPTEEIIKLLIELTEKEIISWTVEDYGGGDVTIRTTIDDVTYYFSFVSLEYNKNSLFFGDDEILANSMNERQLFKKLYDTIMIFNNTDTHIYKAINDLQNLLNKSSKE